MALTQVVTDLIQDDAITHDKLGSEFTTTTAITAADTVDIDFKSAQVFTITSNIAVDVTFINAEIGDTKDLIITDAGYGASSLTFDTTANTITTIAGEYDATAGTVNFIQVVCTAPNTFFLSISKSI